MRFSHICLVSGVTFAMASVSSAQDVGTIRVAYEMDTDKLLVANFSGCEIGGLAFNAKTQLMPKSKFRRDRGDLGPSGLQRTWLWSPGYPAAGARVFSLPYPESGNGVAPPGFFPEGFEMESLVIFAGDTRLHQDVADGSLFPGLASASSWIAAVGDDDWNYNAVASKEIAGDWRYDGAVGELAVKECPDD